MKHFKAHFERHHNVDNGYWSNMYTGKDEKKILVEAVEECLVDNFCLEQLSDEEISKIEHVVNTSESWANIQDYSIWNQGDTIGVGYGKNPEGTQKYDNVWVSVSLIKEQLETVTYIAQDEDIDRLDDISIPDVLEMGVFRYSNGEIKVESL